jgi:hypothetical protein
VKGVERYHVRDLEARPATVLKATTTYTTAVLPREAGSVGMLDLELLFYKVNRGLG